MPRAYKSRLLLVPRVYVWVIFLKDLKKMMLKPALLSVKHVYIYTY